jgi:hypothetical protein
MQEKDELQKAINQENKMTLELYEKLKKAKIYEGYSL